MPTLESDIQRDCVDVAKALGWLVFRMNAGRGRYNQHLAPAGTPDLLLIPPKGGAVWAEIKKPDGVLSEAQRDMHADLRERGERVVVLSSVDEMDNILRGVYIK